MALNRNEILRVFKATGFTPVNINDVADEIIKILTAGKKDKAGVETCLENKPQMPSGVTPLAQNQRESLAKKIVDDWNSPPLPTKQQAATRWYRRWWFRTILVLILLGAGWWLTDGWTPWGEVFGDDSSEEITEETVEELSYEGGLFDYVDTKVEASAKIETDAATPADESITDEAPADTADTADESITDEAPADTADTADEAEMVADEMVKELQKELRDNSSTDEGQDVSIKRIERKVDTLGSTVVPTWMGGTATSVDVPTPTAPATSAKSVAPAKKAPKKVGDCLDFEAVPEGVSFYACCLELPDYMQTDCRMAVRAQLKEAAGL